MMALGAAFFLKRTLAPPLSWDEFRLTTARQQPTLVTLEPSHD